MDNWPIYVTVDIHTLPVSKFPNGPPTRLVETLYSKEQWLKIAREKCFFANKELKGKPLYSSTQKLPNASYWSFCYECSKEEAEKQDEKQGAIISLADYREKRRLNFHSEPTLNLLV
jgi:hypothetical protein